MPSSFFFIQARLTKLRSFSFAIFMVAILFAAPQFVFAQDTVSKASNTAFNIAIASLQRSLTREVKTAEEAKALYETARKLKYQAGQVVALCQLAIVYDRQQQAALSNSALHDALRMAPNVTGVDDAEWALEAASDLQDDYETPSPRFKASFAPIMMSLGKSLAKGTLGLNSKELAQFQEATKLSAQINAQVNKSLGKNTKYKSNFKVPVGSKKDYSDAWLDTLMGAIMGGPNTDKKLSVQKSKRDATKALSNNFAKKGDYAEAYKYYLQYSAYKDSLTLAATSRKLAALAYKQALLKKEGQIALLTKDRQLREQGSKRQLQLTLGLFGFIILLVTILVILGRNNQVRRQVNLKLNEQKEELQHALSELKTTQEQLIQSEKMASLGELTAGIAHEIQNPLNFVNNFSEVSTELVRELKEDYQKTDSPKEIDLELINDIEGNLQKITEHGRRASSIIKGMLEHSRSSSGQKVQTDLNALVEEYLKLSYHGLRAKDNTFQSKMVIELQSGLGEVLIVPQEIGRVLLNIFNNGFYAINQRKKAGINGYEPLLTVKTYKEDGQVKIVIRDNGNGISESVKQKIFQPFFTTKPTGEGTGLGLSLSYDVITKGHGGTIKVDSEENQFTEFTITLPA
jgi:two-component system NtrC family sensor kinase